MKIVVIQNKYGEQINISLPNSWSKNDVFTNGQFGDVTDKFIDYFEKITDNYTNDSQLYFEHVFYIDISTDLYNNQPHHYDNDEFNELVDYPYIGVGKRPYIHKRLTDTQIENFVGG